MFLNLPSRGLHAAVCVSVTDCGSSTVFYGAGSGPEHSTGQHRCLEAHLPKAGRDRLLQLHSEDLKLLFIYIFFQTVRVGLKRYNLDYF